MILPYHCLLYMKWNEEKSELFQFRHKNLENDYVIPKMIAFANDVHVHQKLPITHYKLLI